MMIIDDDEVEVDDDIDDDNIDYDIDDGLLR
jgi:hypothetical protein